MKKILAGILLGLVLGGAVTRLVLRQPPADKPEEKAPGPEITPGSAAVTKQLAAMGLAVASPEAASLTPEVTAYGRVLDPTPLLALNADLATAQATLTASEKEFSRVEKLHADNANASAQAVEAAEAAVQRDRATVDSARARVVATVGRDLAAPADFSRLIAALADGHALARIDVPADEPAAAAPKTARVGLLAGGDLFDATILGPAPTADAQVQGTGFLALLGEHALPVGAALRATVPGPGEARQVLVLPRGAFVRHEGGVFVYVQTDQGGYERRVVTLGPPLAGGVVVSDGVEQKDKVVVTGAQQLLSTELLAATGGGEPD